MSKREKLPVYLTIFDVADALGVPSHLIITLLRCGIHPPYHWARRMKLPRFAPDTLADWKRILKDVDLDTLPTNPPPLKRRPERCERERGATEKELAIFEKLIGKPSKKRGKAA